MVTIGLVKELLFISKAFSTPIEITLKTEFNEPLRLLLNLNILDVWYSDYHIWHEEVDGDASFFGIESCDTISRIMFCINQNDWPSAKQLMQTQEFSLTNLQPDGIMKHESKS